MPVNVINTRKCYKSENIHHLILTLVYIIWISNKYNIHVAPDMLLQQCRGVILVIELGWILDCCQVIWLRSICNIYGRTFAPGNVINQKCHYNDVIMVAIASQITSLAIVYSTVYPGWDQRKHQSSASLAFVRGLHRDRWIPRTYGQ